MRTYGMALFEAAKRSDLCAGRLISETYSVVHIASTALSYRKCMRYGKALLALLLSADSVTLLVGPVKVIVQREAFWQFGLERVS